MRIFVAACFLISLSTANAAVVDLVCSGTTRTQFVNTKSGLNNDKNERSTEQISIDFENQLANGGWLENVKEYARNGSGFLRFADKEVYGKGTGPFELGSTKTLMDIEITLNRFTGDLSRKITMTSSETIYVYSSKLNCVPATKRF